MLVQQGVQARLALCTLHQPSAPNSSAARLRPVLAVQGGPLQPLSRHRVLRHPPPPRLPHAGTAWHNTKSGSWPVTSLCLATCLASAPASLPACCCSTWTTQQTSATCCPPTCPSSKAPWWSLSAWVCMLVGEARSDLARTWPSWEPGPLVRLLLVVYWGFRGPG